MTQEDLIQPAVGGQPVCSTMSSAPTLMLGLFAVRMGQQPLPKAYAEGSANRISPSRHGDHPACSCVLSSSPAGGSSVTAADAYLYWLVSEPEVGARLCETDAA